MSNTTTPPADTAAAPGHSPAESAAAIDAARRVSFELGEIALTPGAHEAIAELGINYPQLLVRHSKGDWGDVSENDRLANEEALTTGARIWSVYKFPALEDGKLWVITDGDDDDGRRHATTILLPSDY